MRAATLRRLACSSRVDLVVERHGSVHDHGRARRVPSAALRRQLLARDRGCRFPRCGTTRRLHAHHVVHWEDGGTTDLDNLIMLCSFHHTFVHDHGWTIEQLDDGRRALRAPHGPHGLAPIQDTLRGASAEAVRIAIEDWGLDLGPDSLTPPHWDGRPYHHDTAIAILHDEIRDATRTRRTAATVA